MPPYTTKRRITTNLKSINNQKGQKIKLPVTLDNQGIKEKLTQNNQIGKNLQQGGRQVGGACCGEAVGHTGAAGEGETETLG